MKVPTKAELYAALRAATEALGSALQVACLCKGQYLCTPHKAWAEARDVLRRMPDEYRSGEESF